MWNVYLQTYLWGWLMSRSATVCFTDVFCIVFDLQWRNKIRQNVTFDVFWDQVVDFRAVGQKSRGDAVILLQRGIKTVKENKVTVEQHWSWSLCNPLVVPSRPEWHVKLYGTFCLWERRELCLCTVLCGKSKITLKWRETHQCDVLSDWTLSDCWTSAEHIPSEQAYLTSDDGQSALWIKMYDYREAGEQTSHTFGSFTRERSIRCEWTLSSLCSI